MSGHRRTRGLGRLLLGDGVLAALVFAALLFALGTWPAVAADLPAGDAALTYQIRGTHTDDPTISPSSTTEQDLGLFLTQEIPNYGLLEAETHWFDPTSDSGDRGWTAVALTDLRLNGARLAVGFGNAWIDASLLPRRPAILVDPSFDIEGGFLRVETTPTGVLLFGGQTVDRHGSFATGVERLPQDVAGVRVRQAIAGRATLSALYLHTEGNGTLPGGRTPRATDMAALGADVRIVGPLALVGEVRYSADPNAAGTVNRTNGLSYAAGPLFEQRGLRVEATAFSLDPSYLPVEGANQSGDRRGLFGGLTWDPIEVFGLFANALRSRNNAAGDPTLTTIETTQVILGAHAFIPLDWPVTLVARGETTRLESVSSPSMPVDSTTNAVYAEAAQVIGDWRPLLRTRVSRLTDGAVSQSSITVDLTGELWWQVTRRSRLWTALEWSDVSATPGLSETTRYLARVGGENRLSAALFVRAEGEVSRTEVLDVASTRLGVNGSVGYRHRFFDLYLDLRRNWVDSSAGSASTTEDLAFLRVTVPFRWGRTTPPPVGRVAGAEADGWGTIAGQVFVDLPGDGQRGPTETGLEGLRLVLDGLPGVFAVTDRDGRFRFDRVATGPHTVRLEVRRLPADLDLVSLQLVETVVTRRATLALDFVVQPLGRIAGRVQRRVVRGDGTALAGGDVQSLSLFLRRGDDIWQTYTDDEGRYAFENVRAGDYEVALDPGALGEEAVADPASRRVGVRVGQAVDSVDFTIRERARPEIRNGGPQVAPPAPRPTAPPPGPPPARAPERAAVRSATVRSRDCAGDSPEAGMIGVVRFASNSADLPRARDLEPDFRRWARWLRVDTARRILVEGHTDRRADDPYNYGLSARRALAVYLRLVAAGAPEAQM